MWQHDIFENFMNIQQVHDWDLLGVDFFKTNESE